MLPVSEPLPTPEKGYWGWGGSNQTTSNFPNAPNLGPGLEEPDLQSDLYVPDVGGDINTLTARVVVLEGDVITINNHLTVIDGEITTLQGSIIPVTFNNIGSTANAAGATVASNAITLQPASNSFGGVVTTGTQSFAGDKTFGGQLTAPAISGVPTGTLRQLVINPSGIIGATNQGLNSLSTIGSTPNANGAVIAGSILTLEPASHSFGGLVTTGAQAFAGAKTFDVVDLVPTTGAAIGVITQNSNSLIHTNGGTQNFFAGYGAGNFTLTGGENTGIGYLSLALVTSGHQNTCIGEQTGRAITTGTENVIVGQVAGSFLTTGGQNTIVGQNAGSSITTGTNNLLLGCAADGDTSNGSNQIIIGGNGFGYTSCVIDGIAARATPGVPQIVTIDPATSQLGSSSPTPTVYTYTMTLDSGTITTSTVRGASTKVMPISLTRIGNQVTLTIAAFSITAVSINPGSVELADAFPAIFRPTYSSQFAVNVQSNGLGVMGVVYVTNGGLVTLQRSDGTTFLTPLGFLYDTHFSWNIV
jgi:hypothetical protein